MTRNYATRTEASAAVKVDTIRLLLSHFERLAGLPAEKHPHYPSGSRPWSNGDVKSIAYDLRTILSALSPEPQEAEAMTAELLAEHSGCGHGTQVEQVTVRLAPGDAVYVVRGKLGQSTLLSKSARTVTFYTHPPAPAVTEALVEAVIQATRKYTRETLFIAEHRDLIRAALQVSQEVKP